MTSFKGKLEKFHWAQIREEVAAVNLELAAVIDKLSPGPKYRLYKATYPYGSQPMEKALLMVPNDKGDLVPITDSSLSQQVRDDLSYNLLSNPVSLVLKNSFEVFLPLEDHTVPMSSLIEPGTAFGAWRMLNPNETEHPAFLWDMTAGARSVFMLPKITEVKKHMQLSRRYGLTMGVPKSLMEHWAVFRQIANHETFEEKWNAEILYFPGSWFNYSGDNKWQQFYNYFYNSVWAGGEFWRNQYIWNIIYSLILKDYEARPSPYVMDTVKYLLHIGMGVLPGLISVQNNLGGPFETIQKVYLEEYKIRNYPPIIIQLGKFNMYDQNNGFAYYSLQFPTASEFKPSSRMRASIISDLHEIRSLVVRYEREIITGKFNIDETSLNNLFKYVQYDYFHNGVDLYVGMRNSKEMGKEDKNLLTTIDGKIWDEFPETCQFAKGCIRLSHKSNN